MIIFVLPESEFILQANAAVAALWPLPKQYTTISSNYYAQRGNSIHKAIDIPAPEGTDIYAVLDGEVIFSGVLADSKDSCGNTVILYHSSIGKYTVYCHASSLCVSKGQKVSQGTVIAKVGNTGDSFGNHLDFKLCTGYQTTGVPWPRGHQDPMSYFSWQYDIIPSNPYISITGYDPLPSGKLPQGKSYPVKGIVSGYPNINHVWGGVYNRDGSKTAQYLDKYVDTGSYNLATYFDPYIIFNNLPVGYYTYKIEATTTDGQYKEIHSDFQIGDPQPIVAPTVRTNNGSYVPGADIDINWDYVIGATGYWIDLYQDGEHIFSSNIGNVNKYTLKKAANAEYGVFVTAFKDDGNWQSACSECCRFSVRDVNAPVVYTNYKYYAPDAEVDIMWDLVDGATGYWIDIYQDGEHVLSKSLNDANCTKYTLQCNKGEYGVFVTAYSENGGWSSACSNCYNFYVQDVEAPKPTTSSNCYTPGSDIEVTWDNVESASGYWVDIYHDGEHISTENIGNVLLYTITKVEVGEYGVFVTAYNERGGWTAAHDEAISFYVKERPSKPILNAVVNDSNVTLKWNQCDNTDFYGVRINNLEGDSSNLYEESYEGNVYTTTLPPGKYYANIASVQKNGFFTFSDDVYFEIEDSVIEGDCNNDGKFNVSDVVLLQKWLIAVPDTHLSSWKAADICEDNRLDVFDLCMMKRKLIYG